MKGSHNKLERLGIGLALSLAILTFISPLVRLRGPGGDLPGDGYHVRTGMIQLRSMLAVVSTSQLSDDQAAADVSRAAIPATGQPLEIPLSVQLSWLSPWLIYLAVACACLALLDLVTIERAVRGLSLVGGSFAALAVVHVILMGSDLQAWATRLLSSGLLSSSDGVIMVTRLLLVNSFQVSPGLGLISLAACLLSASFISQTSAVSRVKSVVRREPRVTVSQPVRVRPLHPNYPVETCISVNLSRRGLLLESTSDHYYVGMEVYITRDPRPVDQPGPEEHGSVVRVHQLADGKSRFAISIFAHPERDPITGSIASGQRDKSRHPIELSENSL